MGKPEKHRTESRREGESQELEEHYFGAIRPTVSAYMKDLDDGLWSLGIPSKTKHNEVAPCQHELAPVYSCLLYTSRCV